MKFRGATRDKFICRGDRVPAPVHSFKNLKINQIIFL
jgi:uncharacterized protein (UPF0210 family)